MSESDYQQRFGGIQRLYGEAEQDCIQAMHVCVIGLGGVGSWAVEALARTGIGKLTLIDYDTIALSNINRQLHATDDSLEQKKSEVLAARVKSINPQCDVTIIDDFITLDTLADYLDRGYSYVIDAIDSILFKSGIIYYCKRNKIPVITTGGAGGLIDPTQIKIRDLNKTHNDPLAAKVRSFLCGQYGYTRDRQRYFGIECIYSLEHRRYPKEGGTVSFKKPGIHGVSMDCNLAYGSSMMVTASFGFIAAARVIEKTLKKHKKV